MKDQRANTATSRSDWPNVRHDRFSKSAVETFLLAQEESRTCGLDYTGVEQLLVGLVAVGEGVAFKALHEENVSVDQIRAELRKLVPPASSVSPDEISMTPRLKHVLELTWNEAKRLQHNYIGTEHLLLGLIREGESAAVVVLRNLGVDMLKLEKRVLDLLHAAFNQ